MHWYDKDTKTSFSVHSMLREKNQYFCICVREDNVSIFTELCNGTVFRQAIFAPLEVGLYIGVDGGMDIAYPPIWRRRDKRGRFTTKREKIMGS